MSERLMVAIGSPVLQSLATLYSATQVKGITKSSTVHLRTTMCHQELPIGNILTSPSLK